MKKLKKWGMALALGSTIGLCVPSSGPGLYAAQPVSVGVQAQPAPAGLALDVILSAKGEIRGAAVNANGSPSAKAKVTLSQGTGKEGLQTTTDEAGRFVFQGVRPGVYGVTVVADKGRTEKIVRVWRQENAPPVATPVAVVKLQGAQANDVVRGQAGDVPPDAVTDEGESGGAGMLLLGTALVGGAVVGIVAISGGFSSSKGPSSP